MPNHGTLHRSSSSGYQEDVRQSVVRDLPEFMASTDPYLVHQLSQSSSRFVECQPVSDPLLHDRGFHQHVGSCGRDSGPGSNAIPGDYVNGGHVDVMGPAVNIGTCLGMNNNGATQQHVQDFGHSHQETLRRLQYHGEMISASSSSPGATKPIRRRMRMITSCLECRRRKLKCNKSNPCINCLKFSRDCLYLGPKLDEASQLRLTEIKEKVGSLERQLERDVAKSATCGSATDDDSPPAQRILADDVEEPHDEEPGLEITPMVANDLTYEDDADGMDDVLDLGVQVGKMRLTEKIGGLNRPRISEEVWNHTSKDVQSRLVGERLC